MPPFAPPNGTSTTYTYDTLNRLGTLETDGPSGTVQSYVFTPRPGGHRERQIQQGPDRAPGAEHRMQQDSESAWAAQTGLLGEFHHR